MYRLLFAGFLLFALALFTSPSLLAIYEIFFALFGIYGWIFYRKQLQKILNFRNPTVLPLAFLIVWILIANFVNFAKNPVALGWSFSSFYLAKYYISIFLFWFPFQIFFSAVSHRQIRILLTLLAVVVTCSFLIGMLRVYFAFDIVDWERGEFHSRVSGALGHYVRYGDLSAFFVLFCGWSWISHKRVLKLRSIWQRSNAQQLSSAQQSRLPKTEHLFKKSKHHDHSGHSGQIFALIAFIGIISLFGVIFAQSQGGVLIIGVGGVIFALMFQTKWKHIFSFLFFTAFLAAMIQIFVPILQNYRLTIPQTSIASASIKLVKSESGFSKEVHQSKPPINSQDTQDTQDTQNIIHKTHHYGAWVSAMPTLAFVPRETGVSAMPTLAFVPLSENWAAIKSHLLARQASFRVRISQWQAAWIFLRDAPIFGIGGNQFAVQARAVKELHNLVAPDFASHSHNTFVEIAVSYGWIALFANILFLACWGTQLWKKKDTVSLAVLGYLVATIFARQFEVLHDVHNMLFFVAVFLFSQIHIYVRDFSTLFTIPKDGTDA